MRVLHLVPRYYPAQGGAEIHMAAFSERLAADGHQVTVATTDALTIEALWQRGQPRVEEEQEAIAGVDVRRFRLQHLPFSSLSYAGIRRMLWLLSRFSAPTPLLLRLARFTPWSPALWRWLEATEQRFDLVAAMGIAFEPLLAAGLHFARKRHLPFIAYPLTHLGAGPQPGRDRLSTFYTMKHQLDLVRASTAAIMQTASERVFYEAQGIPAERLPVVGPGVTPAAVLGGRAEAIREKYGVRAPIIFSLGAMSYDKGTFHLIEAVRQLWQRGEEVELFLAGARLQPFRQYLAQLPPGVRDRLHVLGPVSEQEKRDLFAACHLFAMPSRTDSFGIVYLEAWLYRKPVVAAETWGVRDVVEQGRDGLLVPFADVPALADALSYLIAHPDAAAALGAAGEEKVYRAHTWQEKYRQIRHIYQQQAG